MRFSYRMKDVRPLSEAHRHALRSQIAASSYDHIASQLRTSPLTLMAVLSGGPLQKATVNRLERTIETLWAVGTLR
jgi:hypothetical protein